MIAGFHAEHQRRFRHSDPKSPVEIMHLRVFGRHGLRKPVLSADAIVSRGDASENESRPVYFEEGGGLVDTPVHQRGDLLEGQPVQGPAIVEQLDATTVIWPGMSAVRDKLGNLVIDVGRVKDK
jgi:N-methylhydantoinase A